MRVTENEVIPVVDDTHGTERLKSADGRQVVIAIHHYGKQEKHRTPIRINSRPPSSSSKRQWPDSVPIKMNSNNICRCSLRSI